MQTIFKILVGVLSVVITFSPIIIGIIGVIITNDK
jgi:hypothetical protein